MSSMTQMAVVSISVI